MAERSLASTRLTKLGRYEVLSELGKGAMGIVYLAKDPVIGRMVAIKTIRLGSVSDDDSESREFHERFLREAQTAGILSHNNIVTIHDIGEDPETQISFIAMEYIEGKNLKTLLAEKHKFSYDQIAEMIAQVSEALDYAHRKGIIHRDIKPANIIITTDSKVKITDFGIAKIASSNLTTTGQFLGTPNYMSPEQVSGAPVDGRSDIFSLGVVLYELLTNRKPFQGENLTAISYKIVHEDFTPPAALSPNVPPEFNPIVARAMAKDPWNRYQRGKDFALALHQLRAHIEEQKALQDLGTLVSAAENLPTMKLANLEQLLAEAAGEAGRGSARPSSEVFPPPPVAPDEVGVDTVPPSRKTGGARATGAQATPVPSVAPDPMSVDIAATTRLELPSLEEIERTGLMPVPAPPETPAPPVEPAAASLEPSVEVRPSPWEKSDRYRAPSGGTAATAAPEPVSPRVAPRLPGGAGRELAADLKEVWARRSQEWKQVAKREINPRWFWTVSISVAALALLLLGSLAIRAARADRPSVVADETLAERTKERKEALDQGKKLLTAGRYEESLALFRKVLARAPNNQQARQYAQMAEIALTGRAEEVRRHAEAEDRMRLAQEAFDVGNYQEARRLADEVLLLDAGRLEAQTLRDEAATKLAEAEAAAAAAAAKKKAARPRDQVARRASPVPESRPTAVPVVVGPTGGAAAATSLRLLFEAPVSEGHIMIAVNNEVLLRRNFSFKKKAGLFKTVEETGTVSAMIPVKPGPVAVKAWLSGPKIQGSVLAQASAQLSAGETRTLLLVFSGGNLSIRVQ
jgi:serine/threonine-protein kinase